MKQYTQSIQDYIKAYKEMFGEDRPLPRRINTLINELKEGEKYRASLDYKIMQKTTEYKNDIEKQNEQELDPLSDCIDDFYLEPIVYGSPEFEELDYGFEI